ncbi:10565_t:CDS:2 [Funneliformis geosporum]|nr:10565_t:CDS:2 [Funneliformis geosporum]
MVDEEESIVKISQIRPIRFVVDEIHCIIEQEYFCTKLPAVCIFKVNKIQEPRFLYFREHFVNSVKNRFNEDQTNIAVILK